MSKLSDRKQPDGRAEREELKVRKRRAIKTNLIPSLHISIEEVTSTATRNLRRERAEMSQRAIPFFSLYSFLTKSGVGNGVSKQSVPFYWLMGH